MRTGFVARMHNGQGTFGVDAFANGGKIAEADGDTSFYEGKLMTAKFYFDRLLPRTASLKKTIESGAENLMQMPEEMFAL